MQRKVQQGLGPMVLRETISRRPPSSSSSHDPQEPGVAKCLQRGGGYLCIDITCGAYRPYRRMKTSPDTGLSHAGFRCALSAKQIGPGPPIASIQHVDCQLFNYPTDTDIRDTGPIHYPQPYPHRCLNYFSGQSRMEDPLQSSAVSKESIKDKVAPRNAKCHQLDSLR